MKECERCGARPVGEYDLLDYCAFCSQDLCAKCMAQGCCDEVPALSGSADDAANEDGTEEIDS